MPQQPILIIKAPILNPDSSPHNSTPCRPPLKGTVERNPSLNIKVPELKCYPLKGTVERNPSLNIKVPELKCYR